MKKKSNLIILSFIVIMFLLLIIINFVNHKKDNVLRENNNDYVITDKNEDKEDELESVKSFRLEEFQHEIENLSVNLKYDEINDVEMVIEVAKKAWADYLFVKYPPGPYTGLDKIKQIKVYYDSNNDCWLAVGFYYRDEDIDNGSVIIGWPTLIVNSNGETVAMWIDR